MRRTAFLRGLLALSVSAVVTGVAPVRAQTQPAPRIFSVVEDLGGSTLVISGVDLGEGSQVWVDGQMVSVMPGATDVRLEVEVPAAWRAQPGTYRLTVRTDQGRTDSFEVTVGGVGTSETTTGEQERRQTGSLPGAGADVVPGADTVRRAAAAPPVAMRAGIAPSLIEDGAPYYATKVGYQALQSLVSGEGNTAAGAFALHANATGLSNTAVGYHALDDNNGDFNTAAGAAALQINTTGSGNTAAGYLALSHNTTGSYNAASGASGALYANMTGFFNTASGYWALYNNTTGWDNAAAGRAALYANTSGYANTAAGSQALYSNTTGSYNTAAGSQALLRNTTGTSNTAAGYQSLSYNTTGSYNTAAGRNALNANTTGYSNTAVGFQSLAANTMGVGNTAAGTWALQSNTTGTSNTATGFNALRSNTTGIYNTAAGSQALYANTTGVLNTAAGLQALANNTTGSRNVALGFGAGGAQTTGSNNIYVANAGVPGESSTIRIGTGAQTRTFVAGVYLTSLALANKALALKIDRYGQLGTAVSSRRYKTDIRDMGRASEGVLRLRPVTFRYKDTDDPSRDYGLIAEEVAEVYPDLVARNAGGQVETVLYDELPSLLNELQKQQRTIAAQANQLTEQARQLADQAAQLMALRAAQDRQLLDHAEQLTVLRAGQAAQQALLQKRLAQIEARLADSSKAANR